MDVCDGHRTPPSILRASIPLHMHRSGQEGSNIATSPENIRNAPHRNVFLLISQQKEHQALFQDPNAALSTPQQRCN